MFERFTTAAREVVVGAQAEARALGHSWIGTEHLLVAAVARPDDDVAGALGAMGLTPEAVRGAVAQQLGAGQDDSAALGDLGIDLAAVRRRVEERFGEGALDAPREKKPRRRLLSRGQHLPFTREAKKALELSLREALTTGAKEIRVEHVVLGMLRADGLANAVVARLGVMPDDVRRAVLERLGRAA